MPQIVETFEMRELKALSFFVPIYWYLAPEMHKMVLSNYWRPQVDELLGAYTAWKELKTSHAAQIKLQAERRSLIIFTTIC